MGEDRKKDEKEAASMLKQAVCSVIEKPEFYEPFKVTQMEALRPTDRYSRHSSFRINFRGESFMIRVTRE